MRANGHDGANGAAKGTGIRAKRRHMRAILKEGLEAALRADPEVLAKCKPRTCYGDLVRGLVLEAIKCKATPLKTVMSLIDWEADAEKSGESQAISDEPRWDWSPDGEWETLPEAAADDEASGEEDGPAKKALLRRLEQLMLGDEADRKRAVAIVHAMHTGNFEHTNGGPAPPP